MDLVYAWIDASFDIAHGQEQLVFFASSIGKGGWKAFRVFRGNNEPTDEGGFEGLGVKGSHVQDRLTSTKYRCCICSAREVR